MMTYIVRRYVPRGISLARNERYWGLPSASLPIESLDAARKRAIEESHAHPCVVAAILEDCAVVAEYRNGTEVSR